MTDFHFGTKDFAVPGGFAYQYAELADAFDSLTGKRWMTPALVRHLAKARAWCRKKAD